MGITGWLEVISAVLKFPDSVLRLVKALQSTPEQSHEALVAAIEAEAKTFTDTGRPTWNI